MHYLERAIREAIAALGHLVWKLPSKYSTPLASLLTEFPLLLAKPKGLEAIVSYVETEKQAITGNYSDIAIVIQGPTSDPRVASNVLESVALYRRLFTGAQIVVSTWDDSCLDLAQMHDSVKVLLLKDPGPSHPSNIRRQQHSTWAAMSCAAELGCSFALKTRVDHRIYSPSSLNYLASLLAMAEDPRSLCVSSYGSGRFRLYGFTEQLQFGRVSALLDFWEGDPSWVQGAIGNESDLEYSNLKFLGQMVHETLLNVRYLGRIGFNVRWDWANNLDALKRYFPIADSFALEHVQLGRTRSVYDHVYPWNSGRVNKIEQHLQLADWLCVIAGLSFTPPPTDEEMIDAMKVAATFAT